METFDLTVNRRPVKVKADGNRALLWVLRGDLGLTGTKYGCGEGACGACTVLVDGEATRSCITSVKSVAGKKIVTIEGLADGGKLHPLQEAFVEHDALQCGYCTPGMILTAASLLKDKPSPSEDDIKRGLEDNLCRCGAHERIVRAVKSAAKRAHHGRAK